MDMIETMRRSEAVEISLKNGHVVYGRFLGVSGKNFVLCDPDGAVVFVPSGEDNLAYVRVVSADPEISRTLDRLYGSRPSRRPIEEQRDAEQQPEQEEPQTRHVDVPQAEQTEALPNRVDAPPVILNGPPANRQAAIEAIKDKYRGGSSLPSSTRPAFRPRIKMDEEE